ncbi:class I SAM-dependent rRNA methyltransferase [Bifidobacterium pullorum subsp. saeculare]|uniref:Class I SAM-dependent rRNA methyltransferase n=1 Tax=Bifidobacterium pullorum subsp. saeculare TaxID=78257 RepID=A0A939B9N4_9BIFI|nr:class I SAM-dependent rRNA methyltransferase [Bifidobacterium pullorum]MBM6699708.1 class I SAM-dependent rRNA methyltransferase [Bifidobacterium pullorum subsp. saeculare]
MKSHRPYPTATVTPKAEKALRGGHPWVYGAEVVALAAPAGENGAARAIGPDEVPDGAYVDVANAKGAYLGTGFISHGSKIRIRLVTHNANDRMDAAFWERKAAWAWDYRRQVLGDVDATACRMLFSEADGFPGLVVDRFGDVLVTQTLSLGMERLKPVVFPAIVHALAKAGVAIRGIYERNDVAARSHEGLGPTCGWWPMDGADGGAIVPDPATPGAMAPLDAVPSPDPDATAYGPAEVEIVENGVRYHVDVARGQKTGFFLDQKYNRRAVAKLAHGRRVLDCFTHTGSFALNAVAGGAAHVTAVDISAPAIEMAKRNARLNGFMAEGADEGERIDFRTENVFGLLTDLEASHRKDYDFIILDPPAFTKSRRTVDSAARGYKDINLRALKALPRGGYLATASCSHFMDTERFRRMLWSAARDAGVQLRQIEERQQAPDHPIVWGIPETDYLKFFIFQVV